MCDCCMCLCIYTTHAKQLISYVQLLKSVLQSGASTPLLLPLLLLQEVNATVAQSSGGRLTLGELDTEGVERWVDQKKAQVRKG